MASSASGAGPEPVGASAAPDTSARPVATSRAAAGAHLLPALDADHRRAAHLQLQSQPTGAEPWAQRARAGAALRALEQGRLDEGLLAGFDLSAASPGEEPALLARSLEDTAFLLAWREACRDGEVVARRLAAVPAEQHVRLLWQGCSLWQADLLSETELVDVDAWALIHAAAVHAYLSARGGVDPLERQLLRRFARGRS